MKNLKIKSELLGILIIFVVLIFVTSCEQREVMTLDTSEVFDIDIVAFDTDIVVVDTSIVTVDRDIVDRDLIPRIELNNTLGATPELLCYLTDGTLYYTNLYNAQGQHIHTLYKAKVTEGKYPISIDKDKLQQGIYFIRVIFVPKDGKTVDKVFKLLIDLNQHRNDSRD